MSYSGSGGVGRLREDVKKPMPRRAISLSGVPVPVPSPTTKAHVAADRLPILRSRDFAQEIVANVQLVDACDGVSPFGGPLDSDHVSVTNNGVDVTPLVSDMQIGHIGDGVFRIVLPGGELAPGTVSIFIDPLGACAVVHTHTVHPRFP